jgi:Xaa-Pro aminopeptidase
MSTPRRARLEPIALPDFGTADREPELAPDIYGARVERLRERMELLGLEVVVVYADREHSANISYLTGFDPRFEEALLIVGRGEPAILVGNECWGMAGSAPQRLRRQLFQDFSLPGQPRERSRSLSEILQEEGVERGRRIGVVGWKTYAERWMSDVPAYIVDTVRWLAGADAVSTATGIFMDSQDGLRVISEPQQIAYLEWAACQTSEAVKRLLRGVRPGMSEHEAVALLGWNGTPLSCHLMLSAGPRAKLGLLSPSDRRIARGDSFTTAFGIVGALTCRAGFVVESASELAASIGDYVDRLVAPYFEAVAAWLEALHVGQTGGALHDIIAARLGDPFFGIFLNPGHQIQFDEWVNSPVSPGSTVELRSGMALQVDIIPATGTDYFTTNIEDGVALADASLRRELAARFPDAWSRITARRAFVRDELGIALHDDVLPLSNLACYLPPFVLAPDRAMTLAA